MRCSYLKITEFNAMLALAQEGEKATKVVAYGYDEHDRPLVGFLATDKESGRPLFTKNGDPRINWKPGRSG